MAQQAVSLEPDNWRHHFRLGHAQWGEARLRALDHAIDLYPHFAYARLDMAMVHVARGHVDAAREVVQAGVAEQDRQSRAAERYPAVGFHYLLGALNAMAGHHEAALVEFDREVEQAHQRGLYRAEYAASSLVWRGHAALHLGRLDEAADAFRTALTFIEGYPRARLGLALVHDRLGRPADAAAARADAHAFVTGLRQTDRTAEWLYGSACLSAADGNAPAAAACLNQLLDGLPASAVGWQLPLDPVFLGLHGAPGFARLLDRLADRAK